MIDIIKLIFALLVPMAIGYFLIASLLTKKRQLNLFVHLPLSFLIGTGVITLEMLLLGMIGIGFSIFKIVVFSVIVCAFPVYISVKKMTFIPSFDLSLNFKGLSLLEMFFALLIALRISFSFFEALIKPILSVDAYANWSLRAKVFFFEHGLSLIRSKGYFLGGGQLLYPLNIPLFETWIYTSLGHWNDLLAKVIFPIFYLSLLILVYFSLRKNTTRLFSLLGTYLVSSLPMLLYHSTIEYCDLPLAVYFTASVLMLLDYIESKECSYLYISAILAGIGAWTKSEGLPFFAINLIILAVHLFINKRDRTELFNTLGTYIFIGLIFKLPWELAIKIYQIPKSPWQRIEIEKAVDNLGRLPVIFDQMYQKFFFYGNWNIAWFIFLIVMITSLSLYWSARKLYSLLTVLLCLSIFVFMYYITPNYVWLLDGTTLNRNTMILMPMLVYFISIGINDILSPSCKSDNNVK